MKLQWEESGICELFTLDKNLLLLKQENRALYLLVELGSDHSHLVVLDGVELLLLDPVVLKAHNFILVDLFVDFHF